MAITKSAQKRITSNANKRVFNLRRLRAMREQIKGFTKSLQAGNTSEAERQMSGVYKAIDKAAKRGVIKQNAADRKKSRLYKMLHSKQNS